MRWDETLAQALGQPFITENEADIEEVRVKKQKKISSGTSNQAVPEAKRIPDLSVK